MGLFGFGKKEKDKMKDGLEKTRTGFWGNILNTLTGSKFVCLFCVHRMLKLLQKKQVLTMLVLMNILKRSKVDGLILTTSTCPMPFAFSSPAFSMALVMQQSGAMMFPLKSTL